MNKDTRSSGATYLPDRYRQEIAAKKRRRLVRKIALFCAILAIAAGIFMLFGGSRGGSTGNASAVSADSFTGSSSIPAGTPSPTITNEKEVPPVVAAGGDVRAGQAAGMIPLTEAVSSLRLDYPDPPYSLISVHISGEYLNRSMYLFRIKKAGSTPEDTEFPVLIDAGSGDIYVPGQEHSRISPARAKDIIQEAFSLIYSDTIRVRYFNETDAASCWLFTVWRGNTTILTGSLDPVTGQVASFSRPVLRLERPPNPVISADEARTIADRYILDQNGAPLPVNMSDARYDPLGFPNESTAGVYTLVYNRVVQDIPCDYDGFTITIDSVNGEVIGYERRWNSPENAFSVTADPLIKRYEAILLVQKKAEEVFPGSASNLSIISAEIRWKDTYPAGIVPRPGSIATAWKIQFDDDLIRQEEWPMPGTGWIDARSGKILDFYYRHDQIKK